jgi:glyoxylase-like metal-dependent hydrolase (beta-lactamase superfamily II)
VTEASAQGVHRLPVPTPFLIGRVNLWLIEDDPLTLVDTGPNSGTSLDALERGLAERGRRVEDLRRIVLTHQHLDHLGLVGILARRSGAEVCALDRLAPVVEAFGAHAERDDVLAERLLRRHGVPGAAVTVLRATSRALRAWGGSAPVDRRLRDGEPLEFATRTLTVRLRPGHSPSDTVFHDEARGVLLGGDHLLAQVSSNPLIHAPLDGESDDRPRPLPTYLDSLRATRETDLAVVLPGHGSAIDDHVTLIDERLALHERRAEKIRGLLVERPRTAHAIARELWGDAALTQAYFTLCEVLGHLDLLEASGAVTEQAPDADGVVAYASI